MILAGITSVYQQGGAKRKHQWEEHATNKFRINPTGPTSVSMKPLPDYKPSGYNIKRGFERPINFDDLFRNKNVNQQLAQKFPQYVSNPGMGAMNITTLPTTGSMPSIPPVDTRPIKQDSEDVFFDADEYDFGKVKEEEEEKVKEEKGIFKKTLDFISESFFEKDDSLENLKTPKFKVKSKMPDVAAPKNQTSTDSTLTPISEETNDLGSGTMNPKTYNLNNLNDVQEIADRFPGDTMNYLNEQIAFRNAKKFSKAKDFENNVLEVETRVNSNQALSRQSPRKVIKKSVGISRNEPTKDSGPTSPESLSPAEKIISSKRKIKNPPKKLTFKNNVTTPGSSIDFRSDQQKELDFINAPLTSPESSGSDYVEKSKGKAKNKKGKGKKK